MVGDPPEIRAQPMPLKVILSEPFHGSSKDTEVRHPLFSQISDETIGIKRRKAAIITNQMSSDLMHHGRLIQGTTDEENLLFRHPALPFIAPRRIYPDPFLLHHHEGNVKFLFYSHSVNEKCFPPLLESQIIFTEN